MFLCYTCKVQGRTILSNEAIRNMPKFILFIVFHVASFYVVLRVSNDKGGKCKIRNSDKKGERMYNIYYKTKILSAKKLSN